MAAPNPSGSKQLQHKRADFTSEMRALGTDKSNLLAPALPRLVTEEDGTASIWLPSRKPTQERRSGTWMARREPRSTARSPSRPAPGAVGGRHAKHVRRMRDEVRRIQTRDTSHDRTRSTLKAAVETLGPDVGARDKNRHDSGGHPRITSIDRAAAW